MPAPIVNLFVKAIAHSPLHAMLGDGGGVISVEGRKTGKVYSTPINVVKEEGCYTVTSLRGRSWWRNLRGGRPATLWVAGRRHAVRGEVVEDRDGIRDGLRDFFTRHPKYAKYFGVRFNQDGQPLREDVERAAGERVIIRLHETANGKV